MTSFPHLAQRLFNVPIAIHPQKAEVVMAALADRLGIASMFRGGEQIALQPQAFDDDDYGGPSSRSGRRECDQGYDLVGGVAVIHVTGTLVQKLGTLRPYSGMTGYDGIRLALLAAMQDPEVQAVAFDIDSPGGEVAGCFDLVDVVYRLRGEKPMWAILDENAFSAAYALASACDHITVPRTGGTGSVGVIGMHVDLSQALGKAGITVTMIRYGEHKAEGNPYEPLSKDALGRMQADIDTMGELFIDTVARNRGLKASEVRATKAGTFLGDAGVRAGFADAVSSPGAAFRALLNTL
ncbi:S49 family peptidase [Roseomonas xinghualingensis]|uniref:S49 family peptidase n=1 Tax=Roseomonas xinghualingensis TaxID=2986475 RepID=UPI0021F1AD5E|nr:S49 family peptidase [Roseomonas sp. SXEYE001]MCV4206912.1 S49 family peptidase [Roseomonas sp. SXEYE001]